LSIDGKSKIQKSCRCMWVFQAFGSRRLMVDGPDYLWRIYQSTLPILGLRFSIIFHFLLLYFLVPEFALGTQSLRWEISVRGFKIRRGESRTSISFVGIVLFSWFWAVFVVDDLIMVTRRYRQNSKTCVYRSGAVRKRLRFLFVSNLAPERFLFAYGPRHICLCNGWHRTKSVFSSTILGLVNGNSFANCYVAIFLVARVHHLSVDQRLYWNQYCAMIPWLTFCLVLLVSGHHHYQLWWRLGKVFCWEVLSETSANCRKVPSCLCSHPLWKVLSWTTTLLESSCVCPWSKWDLRKDKGWHKLLR
jgi:hypothetical protein